MPLGDDVIVLWSHFTPQITEFGCTIYCTTRAHVILNSFNVNTSRTWACIFLQVACSMRVKQTSFGDYFHAVHFYRSSPVICGWESLFSRSVAFWLDWRDPDKLSIIYTSTSWIDREDTDTGIQFMARTNTEQDRKKDKDSNNINLSSCYATYFILDKTRINFMFHHQSR